MSKGLEINARNQEPTQLGKCHCEKRTNFCIRFISSAKTRPRFEQNQLVPFVRSRINKISTIRLNTAIVPKIYSDPARTSLCAAIRLNVM